MFAVYQNTTFKHIEDLALSATRFCVVLTPYKHTPTEQNNRIINIQIQQIVLRALWFLITRQTVLQGVLSISFYTPLSTFMVSIITSLAVGMIATQLTNNIIKRINKNRLYNACDDQKIDKNDDQTKIQQLYYDNNPMLLPVLHGQLSHYAYILEIILGVGTIMLSVYDMRLNANVVTGTSCVLNTLSLVTTRIIKPISTYYNRNTAQA